MKSHKVLEFYPSGSFVRGLKKALQFHLPHSPEAKAQKLVFRTMIGSEKV